MKILVVAESGLLTDSIKATSNPSRTFGDCRSVPGYPDDI